MQGWTTWCPKGITNSETKICIRIKGVFLKVIGSYFLRVEQHIMSELIRECLNDPPLTGTILSQLITINQHYLACQFSQVSPTSQRLLSVSHLKSISWQHQTIKANLEFIWSIQECCSATLRFLYAEWFMSLNPDKCMAIRYARSKEIQDDIIIKNV